MRLPADEVSFFAGFFIAGQYLARLGSRQARRALVYLRGMSYFVVIREAGPAWTSASSTREQEQWPEHAAFMEALVDDGFVVLGGPLGEGPTTLLIVEAGSEDEIQARLADDPWTPMELLVISKIEPWEVLLSSL